ncbi:DUF1579 domain-containing protein [Enhydrobacter sp.]|jgi:hypothetical protein|uniref:DUF1579 domain-containing protein n=1 Tax=Enhydrobacter sp. TaxID=1894999 RepID=UPI002623345A|nr:DUF1579 domain-containing protein [Enhydrobacter sp.]WIM14120.1 MAG: hypothetical protein OJF58_005090 [Enhydrobacter sp.]
MLQTRPKPSPDFDFLMGIWNCRHRYLARRLDDCHDWIEFDGTCAARKVLDGFGNSDESDIALPGDRYRGMSLRLYDFDKDRWTIHWYDSRCPGCPFPPVVGRFAKGIGTFYGDDEWCGRPIRVRYVWSRIAAGSARWEQAFSLDEGNSWETNWIMDFRRV